MLFVTTLILVFLPVAAYADPISAAMTAVSAAAGSSSILGTIGTVLSVGSSLMQAGSQRSAGRAAAQNADFQARQLEQRAGQERASSQRDYIEQRRQTKIVQSNARAAAGASGGSVVDPTMLNIQSGIARQGDYNALTALFEGEERAKGLEFQGTTTRADGQAAKKAASSQARSTIMGAGLTLFDKYSSGGSGGSSSKLPWQSSGYINPATGKYYG